MSIGCDWPYPIEKQRYFIDPDQWFFLSAYKINEHEWHPYRFSPIRRPREPKRLNVRLLSQSF